MTPKMVTPIHPDYELDGTIDGIEHKHVVRDIHGKRWLLKVQNPNNELIGTTIAAAIGLPVPKVYKYVGLWSCEDCAIYSQDANSEPVLIEWLDGVKVFADKCVDASADEWLRIIILDAVTGNSDRHMWNVLVDAQNRLIPIDYGFIFVGSTLGGFDNVSKLRATQPTKELTQSTLAEIAGALDQLADDESAFEDTTINLRLKMQARTLVKSAMNFLTAWGVFPA